MGCELCRLDISSKIVKEVRKLAAKAKKSTKSEETYKVKGEQLLAKVKKLIHEGNVRRITIKDKNGKVIMILPLTIGVVGAVIAPPLAAVGAVAALVTECTVSVERVDIRKT